MQSASYNVAVSLASVNLAAAATRPAWYFMLEPEGKKKMKIVIGSCCLSVLSSIALLVVVIFKGMHPLFDRLRNANYIGGQAYEMAQSSLLLLNNTMPIIYEVSAAHSLLNKR